MTEFFRRYIYSNAPLILSLSALGWAGNTVAGRLAVGEISPMVIVFMRWTIVTGLLGYTQRHSWPKALPLIKGRLKWVFAMAGFGFTFFNALFYTAAQHTTAINLGIIQCTMPAYIILGAAIIFRNRLTSLQLAGTALTMIGVVIIIAKGDVQILAQLAINQGDWLMLLACLFYSGYTIGLRNRPQIGNFTMMFFLAIAAASGITVDEYTDEATGFMADNGEGRTAMIRVTLRPCASYSGERIPDAAKVERMHHKAHELCFIANSVRTEVVTEIVS